MMDLIGSLQEKAFPDDLQAYYGEDGRLRRWLAIAEEAVQFLHVPSAELPNYAREHGFAHEVSAVAVNCDTRKAHPGAISLLFYTYELIFGQTKISRLSPGVRFIALAIKKIGWGIMTCNAIAKSLERECKREPTLRQKRDGFFVERQG
jgi:hypothetical protein